MLMKLKAPGIAGDAHPGQFLMLSCSPHPDPLLRRPFAVHDVWLEEDPSGKPAGVLVLYEVVGRGTAMLSQMRAGQNISVVGPLGRGFAICETARALLVAGAVGVAPLAFLARALESKGCRVTAMLGARTKDLLYAGEFPNAGETILATDDGSAGLRGPVTGALEAALDDDCADVTVYAAGPTPMLRRVADLAAFYGVSCQLSLEAFMACGIGACNGCVVRALGEDGEPAYLRVCKEGPVFNSRRIISF